jgi:hypothetical protein
MSEPAMSWKQRRGLRGSMTANRHIRLILALLVAFVLSSLIGIALDWVSDLMPCEGEGLACGIDEAVGGYGTLIAAVLGPVIFGVTLSIAPNRIALLGATLVLLTPFVAFYALSTIEAWRYVGFYPYPNLRTFLVLFLPPAATILAQCLILRTQLEPRGRARD